MTVWAPCVAVKPFAGPYPFAAANLLKLFSDAQVFVVALVGLVLRISPEVLEAEGSYDREFYGNVMLVLLIGTLLPATATLFYKSPVERALASLQEIAISLPDVADPLSTAVSQLTKLQNRVQALEEHDSSPVVEADLRNRLQILEEREREVASGLQILEEREREIASELSSWKITFAGWQETVSGWIQNHGDQIDTHSDQIGQLARWRATLNSWQERSDRLAARDSQLEEVRDSVPVAPNQQMWGPPLGSPSHMSRPPRHSFVGDRGVVVKQQQGQTVEIVDSRSNELQPTNVVQMTAASDQSQIELSGSQAGNGDDLEIARAPGLPDHMERAPK